MIGALGLLFLLALLALVLHVLLIRPLYLLVRGVAWTRSGAVERDEPAEPVTEEHPRFVTRLTARPSDVGSYSFHFALGGDGRVLVAQEEAAAFGLWDPATSRRTGRLPVLWSTNSLVLAVGPDGHLLADLAGAQCHLARIYPLTDAQQEILDVPIRQSSAVLDRWLTDGEDGATPRECEIVVAAFALAAATAQGERPLVVVVDLQSFVGGRRHGRFGPGAFLIRTYDVARADAPLLVEVLHPTPRRDGPHDCEALLSPGARFLAVAAVEPAADVDADPVVDAVEVLDPGSGKVVCRLDDDPGRPLAFSPDGHLLVGVSRRTVLEQGLLVTTCELSVWDVPTGRRRARWVAPVSGVWSAAVTDGPAALVALGARYGQDVRHHSRRGTTTVRRGRSSVTVHRVDDGAVLHDFPVNADQVAFTAGGRLAVSGRAGLTLWDVAPP